MHITCVVGLIMESWDCVGINRLEMEHKPSNIWIEILPKKTKMESSHLHLHSTTTIKTSKRIIIYYYDPMNQDFTETPELPSTKLSESSHVFWLT